MDWLQQDYRDGYPRVSMTGDRGAAHASAPDAEESLAHEGDLDGIVAGFDVRVLYRYDQEDSGFLTEMLGLHYRTVSDEIRAAVHQEPRLPMRGETDISHVGRFAAVLHTATLDGADTIGRDRLVSSNPAPGRAPVLPSAGCGGHPGIEVIGGNAAL